MSFHDFLARHSSAGEVIVLIASGIPAALGTRKLLQEASEDKGIKKAWRWTELAFFWLLPVMVFFSTKAVDWASDDALKNVKAEMQVQVDEAKAATLPKPFDERLLEVLNEINPQILRELKLGIKVAFSGFVKQSQKDSLDKLFSEPDASKFITPVQHGESHGIGNAGPTAYTAFVVSTNLANAH